MNCLRKLVAIAALAGLASTASADAIDGLVVFGNSISDAGNVAVLIGPDPTQTVTSNSYIPGRPYASGQFTNGNVWARTFADALGLGAFAQPSLAGGWNFAFGGARTATDGPGQSPSLAAQQSMFFSRTAGVASPSALYVIEGGGNDARDALRDAAMSATPATVIGAYATAYAQSVGTLVDNLQAAGGTNIVVWNVPNLGLAPAVLAQGPGASFLGSLVAQSMNAALTSRLALETDVLLFDFFAVQSSLVANAAAFGLTNVTDACGAVPSCNPSTYLYWDGIHPTSAGHALLARAMLEQTAFITAVPEPETYALMLAGLGAVALARRRAQKRAAAR
jgi:outer membrane lipase/esterase